MKALSLLTFSLLCAVVSASQSDFEFEESHVETSFETHVYNYNGVQIQYVIFHGYKVIEPEIILTFFEKPVAKKTGSGSYEVAIPLEIKAPASASSLGGSGKWASINLKEVKAHFASELGDCKICSQISVLIKGSPSDLKLVFQCKSESQCNTVGEYFYDNSPYSFTVFNHMQFELMGLVHGKPIKINKTPHQGKPRPKPRPVPRPGPSQSDNGVYYFEPGKMLLYTTKANVGRPAYETFTRKQSYPAGPRGSLPSIYRSDLLDSLRATVRKYNMRRMVAEMRKGGKVVARVVFDVSRSQNSLNKNSWFRASRVVSSYPYKLGKSGFNFFAIVGDAGIKRRFFINNRYSGCPNDVGFWAVIDQKGVCKWEQRGWRGSAPTLAYNPLRGTRYSRNVRYADRLLVYLTNRGESLGRSLADFEEFYEEINDFNEDLD